MVNGRNSPGIDATIAHFLKSFHKPARLLVAVSGGGDSVGLLLALDEALKTGRFSGFSLLACTVDHALRANSADEADWVAALCARRGISHLSRRWDGPKPAAGIQAQARNERYALLSEVARDRHADAILTAHNRDDQFETIAMRKERRSEGAGLAGIAPATLVFGSTWVLRPFLDVPRADIRAYLQAIGQDWLEDPSNRNRTFERVRVRLDGRDGSDAVMSAATEMAADVARASELRMQASRQGAAFLSGQVRVYEAALARLPASAVPTLLGGQPEWRALLALVAVLGGREHHLDKHAAERLRLFLESTRLSRMTAGRVVFDRRREGLFLYREHRGVAPVTIAPLDWAIWDGRWRVYNRSSSDLTVQAAAEVQGCSIAAGDVPSGVARRAARSRPLVLAGDARAEADLFSLEPVLSPYDRYLPVFDLRLAQALAALFARAPYPALPVRLGCDDSRRGDIRPDGA